MRLDDVPDVPECPLCGGEAQPMGRLGNRLHLCCRACGLWSSITLESHPNT